MARKLYRLAETDLFLRDDGLFTPVIEPDDDIVDVTPDNGDEWQRFYLGVALQRAAVRGGGGASLPPEADHGTQLMLRAMQLLPYGNETVEFALILNELVRGPHGEDPLLENLKRLHERLAELKDDVLATWVTAREDNLSGVLAQSTAALKTANDFVRLKADRNDPVWSNSIAIALRDSLVALQTFSSDTDRGYWRRPFSIRAVSQSGDPTIYYRGWMPHLPDRADVDQFNRVWDYRWALPALMTTVTIRLMVVTAFSQGTREEQEVLRDEVKGYIAIIGNVFTKRWQGLRCLTQLNAQQRDDFATYGRFPMAAADIYGGDYIGGIFYPSAVTRSNFDPWLAPAEFWDFRTSGRPVDLSWTDHNAKRFGEHWWNQLYLSTGLEALFLYLTQLRVIYDGPWFSTRLTELEDRIRDVLTDEQKAKKARLAAHLSASIESLEPSERAVLTQSIYDAMDRGGERSDEIVRDSIKQLQRLL